MNPITLTITLPALSTDQAIGFCDALQAVIDAIWDVHGTAMAEVFEREALLEPDPDDWRTPACDPSEDDVPL